MLGPIDERTPPMTPQLALRVAMVGGLALLLFAIIFFRLWFLQVLSGTRYVAEAQSNRVAHVPVAAPRGEIVDASGTPLVQSVKVPSIQIAPRSLPAQVVLDGALKLPVPIPAQDEPLLDRLARLLGISTTPHRCTYTVFWSRGPVKYTTRLATIPCRIAAGVAQAPFANVAIKTDVPTYIQDYIEERINQFRGVLTQDTYIRKYPLGDAGAQLFGSLAQVTPAELKVYKGVNQGDIIGQSGLEAQYNQYLQGVNGSEGIKVDSQGQFEGYAKGVAPIPGDTLKLALNSNLEKVGQQALAASVAAAPGSTGGAFVAMNPENGQIYAMGSDPTYNPGIFTKPISNRAWKQLTDPASNHPLLNRAINGEGPDGSTFKVITATAALESGDWGLNQIYDDTGSYCPTPGSPASCRHNAGGAAYGPIGLVFAIQDSVDTFFYNLGGILDLRPIQTWAHPDGGELQKWANAYGIGRPTGVDLPGESVGSMASPKYFADMWRLQQDCVHHRGYYKTHPQPAGGCQIADTGNWYIGDNVNAGVGQGDVQLTPLQLAVVYAAVANGGNIVTPHLAESVQSPTGQIIAKVNPGIRRHLDIAPAYLSAIRTGLRDAVTSGTSADTLGSFPQQVYGKTGTAQYINAQNVERDSAWYACYVPASATSKPIVVVVWVQNGGYGDIAAAPVARMILGQWFYGKPGKFQVGANKTL